MKILALTMIFLVLGVGASYADDDPIAARQALMKANGKATKTVVDMLKGATFDLAKVEASLNTYIDASEKGPLLFPPGSDKGKTGALPAIWEHKDDFNARFGKFGKDSKAAIVAIKDQASFKATIPGVLKNCNGCHETYRAKE